MSVTSTLPSLMNGGKDFSDWSKRDDLLYRTLRVPVETVLGRDGLCLGDCGIAGASLKRRGYLYADARAHLVHDGAAQQRHADMEFAVVGLPCAASSPLVRRRTRGARWSRCASAMSSRGRALLPNIDALLCRIDLHAGDLDGAEAWYARRRRAIRCT